VKALKIILIVIGVVVILIVALFAILLLMNRQGVVEPYAIGETEAEAKVLIASQGSKFKNALVDSLTSRLTDESVYIGVIDVTGFGEIKEDDWDAIVIIHTTEQSAPPADVKQYLDRAQDLSKVIMVTTSGSGEWKSGDYDVEAITSASKTEEIPGITDDVVEKLGQLVHVIPVE
jgi:hypothetical protein